MNEEQRCAVVDLIACCADLIAVHDRGMSTHDLLANLERSASYAAMLTPGITNTFADMVDNALDDLD